MRGPLPARPAGVAASGAATSKVPSPLDRTDPPKVESEAPPARSVGGGARFSLLSAWFRAGAVGLHASSAAVQREHSGRR